MTCNGPSAANCTSCLYNKTLSKGKCQCPDGQYQATVNGSCLPCKSECRTCEMYATNCTGCFKGAAVENGKCVCKEGTNRQMINKECICVKGYAENNRGVCEKCPELIHNCLECSSAS